MSKSVAEGRMSAGAPRGGRYFPARAIWAGKWNDVLELIKGNLP
jgi:hypothetical protein